MLAGLVLAAFASSALAITYGVGDGTRHPHTCALVGKSSSGTYPYCSGAMISPTVFLTAAHCDLGNARVTVTFDEKYSTNFTLDAGTYHADLRYSGAQNDLHDIAVLVFDAPIAGITPAQLTALGSLDSLGKNHKITAVGYGGQEPVIEKGAGMVIHYEDNREFSVGTLNAINPSWLHVSQNPSTGNGGACYGDSGGPNFLGAGDQATIIIAATTITGDFRCRATNVIYRLDTVSARQFLGQFVTLP